jgi:hypothetical protein
MNVVPAPSGDVPRDLAEGERADQMPQVHPEVGVLTEHELSDTGVQAVGADEEVGTLGRAVAQCDLNFVIVLGDRLHGDAEADRGDVTHRLVQHRLQIAAENGDRLFAERGLGECGRHRELLPAVGLGEDRGEHPKVPFGQRGQHT